MARRRELSCNDVLACLGVLSNVDSEHEDDIEDCLSWDESDSESNEVSGSYSEISTSESDSEEKQDGDSREILGKRRICVVTEAKSCKKNTSAKYCQRESRTEREWMSSRHTLEII
jgi:hypothetical protein